MARKLSNGESLKNGKLDQVSQDKARCAGGGTGKPENMGELVTPHVEITSEYKFLSCGVDTLDISAYVFWEQDYEKLMESLEKGRHNAREVNNPTLFKKTSQGSCLIYPNGRPPMYAYHVHIRDFHFFIARSQHTEHYPNVYVSINSKTIWRDGLKNAVNSAHDFILELGGRVRSMKPSRVDLCADYHIPGGIAYDFLKTLGVPENVKTAFIGLGAKLETYYIGSKSSPIRARIYDKGKEIDRSKKHFFKDIWGLDSSKDVWRVEYQLRRVALKQFGINSIEDLYQNVGGLWSYLTHNYYSLRCRNDKNISRCDFHPLWRDIQSISEKFGAVTEISRNLERGNPADWDFYLKRGASALLGFAANRGLPDIDEAVNDYVDFILSHWQDKDWPEAYAVKSVEIDGPFTEEDFDDDIQF